MAFPRKNYAALINDLREVTGNLPALAAKLKGTGPVQKMIDQIGLDILCYEATNGFFDGRALVTKRAELLAKSDKIKDIEMYFRAEESGAELLLIIDVRDGRVGVEQLAAATAEIDSRARCLRIIAAALRDIDDDLKEVEQALAKLSGETRKALGEPDPLTQAERQAFQAIFDAEGAALFGTKSEQELARK